MEITSVMLYWITRLTAIHQVSQVLLVFGGLSMFTLFIISFVNSVETDNWSLPRFRATMINLWVIVLLGTGFIGSVNLFVPTAKQMCAILFVPPILNNEEVRKIPNKFLELTNEWLEELKPTKNK